MAKKTSKPVQAFEGKPVEAHQEDLGLERLVFFSDAVFAIAITLLALEIRLPPLEGELTNEQLLQSLLALWPAYLGYLVSFLVIGGFWIGHHRRFRLILRYDANLILLNLLLLMVVAFIPFPTSIISEYGNQTATIFYALTVTVAGLLSAAIWLYSSHHNRLTDAHLDVQFRRRESRRTLVIPLIFLLSIGLAFINDDWAKFSWILIAIVFRFV